LVMADVRGTGPGSEGSSAGARRENWSRRIGEALEKDLFVLHAQRIVDVASGETVRHELFLRMVDGEGLTPAGEFVLAAEGLGSIREVDRWVAGRAIEVAAAGHPVDLNLSVRSLDDLLLELIRHRTAETGADPGDLVLELSEEQLVVEAEAGEGFVHAVHELGCRIALDGTSVAAAARRCSIASRSTSSSSARGSSTDSPTMGGGDARPATRPRRPTRAARG
jgi:predicted signal transduction protein with EAL and GGDEF domain